MPLRNASQKLGLATKAFRPLRWNPAQVPKSPTQAMMFEPVPLVPA